MPASDVTIEALFIETKWINPFADVSSSDWFYNAVEYACEHDIMQGTSASKFEPNAKLIRAMLVQMLYNLEGQPDAGRTSFTDVAAGAWYADAIAWAAEAVQSMYNAGILNGKGNPKGSATRAEVAQMFMNFMEAIK